MKTLVRSLAIVAGMIAIAPAMPAQAHANGFYGYYGSGCCAYAPMRSYYYPRYCSDYDDFYRPRHSVFVVIVIRHHHRHFYPYAMNYRTMGGYGGY